jgi:phage terminase large subunit-like protein
MVDLVGPSRNRSASWRKKKNYDILTGGYLDLLADTSVATTDRDRLIQNIIETDEIQKETIRRFILANSRLDILVKFLGYDLRDHHAAYAEYMRRVRQRKRKRGLLLAPRGSGKSTICNTCYVVLRLLQDPNLKILIGSRTMEQAMAFLSAIKGNFEKEQVIEVFGDMRGPKWDEKAIDIVGGDRGHKEHSIHVAGADGSVVSKHFDIIIADDLVEEKNAKTELQRETVRKFFYKSLLPCLKSGGELWVLGTKYHPEDLYTHLDEKDLTFKNSIVVFPGVFDKETGEMVDLVQREDGTFEVPEHATVWDPEGFPEEEVCSRRAGMTQGDFESQYQNRSDMLRGDFFDADTFQYYTESPKQLIRQYDLAVWTGVDLAISESDQADEFAIVTVGIERATMHVYILDYLSGRFDFDKQMDLVEENFANWDPVHTFIETNAYQAALQQSVVKHFPEVRSFPLITTKDKVTRALSLSAYYKLKRVYHRKNRSAKLEGQLTAFPHRKLKDIFDALYFAVWGAVRGGRRGRRRKKEPGLFG